MDKGSYRGPKADFSQYAVSCFTPHLFYPPDQQKVGCGPSALALLTGVPPERIIRQRRQKHYSDRFMVAFLRRHGLRVLKLTQCLVSQNDTSSIGGNHVILLSQLFSRNEGTWGVTFGSLYYHNFHAYSLDELSLLNKPVLSAYLVCDTQFRLKQVSRKQHGNLTGRFQITPICDKTGFTKTKFTAI
jgi:hypothetical protein